MGPYLESLLTWLAEFTISYIFVNALVGLILVGILLWGFIGKNTEFIMKNGIPLLVAGIFLKTDLIPLGPFEDTVISQVGSMHQILAFMLILFVIFNLVKGNE